MWSNTGVPGPHVPSEPVGLSTGPRTGVLVSLVELVCPGKQA